MCDAVSNALKVIRALTPEERSELFDLFEQEFPAEMYGLDPEFVREIERRSDDIDAGRGEFMTWEEVRSRLEAELVDAA